MREVKERTHADPPLVISSQFSGVSHGKYSEIVWLPMSRIASTSTNADRLTGLPNTYLSCSFTDLLSCVVDALS